MGGGTCRGPGTKWTQGRPATERPHTPTRTTTLPSRTHPQAAIRQHERGSSSDGGDSDAPRRGGAAYAPEVLAGLRRGRSGRGDADAGGSGGGGGSEGGPVDIAALERQARKRQREAAAGGDEEQQQEEEDEEQQEEEDDDEEAAGRQQGRRRRAAARIRLQH